MSTAWYKSRVVPTLLQTWQHRNRSVEVWKTTCIVTNFGKPTAAVTSSVEVPVCKVEAAHVQVLINPANPELSGVSKFPYFPRGGPTPKQLPNKDAHHIMGYVSSWGGMEVGDGMLFPSSVVDGLVHQLGGWKLEWACKWIGNKCPEGTAVMTGPGNEELEQHYDHIIHTVPPFYHHYEDGDADDCLRSCYQKSLQLASTILGQGGDSSPSSSSTLRIASPLLGAGCRGFPLNVTIDIAATEAIDWMTKSDSSDDSTEMTVAFGIPEPSTANHLVDALNTAFEKGR